MMSVVKMAIEDKPVCRNVCLPGVALNSKANAEILASGPLVDKVFVQPAA